MQMQRALVGSVQPACYHAQQPVPHADTGPDDLQLHERYDSDREGSGGCQARPVDAVRLWDAAPPAT